MKLIAQLTFFAFALGCAHGRRLEDVPPEWEDAPTEWKEPHPDEGPVWPPHTWEPEPPGPSPVRGDLCGDAVTMDTPMPDVPTIVAGRMDKLYYFPQCYHWIERSVVGAVYTIQGTGGVLDASSFQGPNYNEARLTVFRGCPGEAYPAQPPQWQEPSGPDGENNNNNNNYYYNGGNNNNNNNNNGGNNNNGWNGGSNQNENDGSNAEAMFDLEDYAGTYRSPVRAPSGHHRRLDDEDDWDERDEGGHNEENEEEHQEEEDWPDPDHGDHDEEGEEQWPDNEQEDHDHGGEDGWPDEGQDEDYPGRWNNGCVEGHSYDGVRWQTEVGVEYTVIVHAQYSSEPRDFVFQVSAIETTNICGNETVSTDLGVAAYNTTLTALGSTRDGLFFDLPTCDTRMDSRTVTYRVTVPEDSVRVKASVQGNAQVSVYTGGCDLGQWSCPGRNDWNDLEKPVEDEEYFPVDDVFSEEPQEEDEPPIHRISSSEVSWHNGAPSTSYLIAINSCCGSQATGDFWLSVTMSDYGNVCRDSKAVTSLDSFSESIDFEGLPFYQDLYSCRSYRQERIRQEVAFYEIQGTGETILAMFDDWSYRSARLSLFQSTSCDSSPRCVASDDWNSRLLFTTIPGQTYYLGAYLEYDTGRGDNQLSIRTVTYGTICEDAVDLGTIRNETVQVTGSTEGANFYQNFYSCNYGNIESSTRIYSFAVAQTGLMMISLKQLADETDSDGYRFRELQLSVFRGSCFRPECMYTQTQYLEDSTRRFSLEVNVGVTYFVAISDGSPSQMNDFDLTLEAAELGNVCEDALPIESVENGLEISGSTTDANQYEFPERCSYNGRNSPAVIYKVEMPMMAYLTVTANSFDFNAQVSVFERNGVDGQECNSESFSCVNQDRSGYQVSWEARALATYFVVVAGCCSPSETGDFTLQFELAEIGDVCEDVVDLGVLPEEGLLFANSTDGAPSYDFQSPCYESYGISPATALFSIVAKQSGQMTAMLRSVERYSLQMSVYSGSCSSPSCVGTANQYSPFTWDVAVDQRYFIAVHEDVYNVYNRRVGAGDFVLAIKSAEEGNICNDVQDLGSVGPDGMTTLGTTQGGGIYSSLPSCYNDVRSPAAVYSATASEEGTITAKVTSNDFDPRVSVYSGSCDGWLSCNGGQSWRSTSWPASPGEMVYIFVHGCCDITSTGSFLLELDVQGTGDVCADATDLGPAAGEDILVVGSTEDSNSYPNLQDCSYSRVGSRANVYTVTANSTGRLHASARPTGDRYFDAQLSVYEGECDSLQCTQAGDRYARYSSNEHIWNAVAGKVYYIVVHSYSLSEAGEYILLVESISSGDICKDSVDLGVLPSDGLIEAGSTNDANFYTGLESCYDAVNSPAMIYNVTSTGGTLTAIVDGYGLNARLAVYRYGDTCGGEDLQCASNQAYHRATWDSTEGESFLVVVFGCCGTGSTGDFVLRIDSVDHSDACEDTNDLGIIPSEGLTQEGTTEDAGVFQNLEKCGYNDEVSASILYSVTGTGDTFVAKVVGDSRPEITLYQGSCDALFCVVSETGGAEAIWNTIEGEIYFILVSSQSSARTGDFVLSVERTAKGDLCGDAEPLGDIPSKGMLLSGSTVGMAYYSLPTCFDTINSPAKVYSLTVASPRTIYVSGDSFDLDTQVSVLKGGCNGGEPVCVDFHSWRSVQWAAEVNTTYTVVVSGCCGPTATGTFLLQMDVSEAGDPCEHAIELEAVPSDGLMVEGSTEEYGFTYTNEQLPCNLYEGAPSPTVLYSLQGTGDLMTASIPRSRGSYEPEVRLSLYRGGCGSLECTEYSSDFYEGGWSVSWDSAANSTYYLAIYGCCEYDATADYKLHVDRTPSSDLCTETIPLSIPAEDEAVLAGSFDDEGAFFPALSSCNGRRTAQPVVTYSIVGTGSILTVSVNSGARISVSGGNCTDPICIGGYGYEDKVSWETEVGTAYYIAVSPRDGSKESSFDLTMKVLATTDICSGKSVNNVGEIPEAGIEISGSTSSSMIFGGISSCFEEFPEENKLVRPGVAYSMQGDGRSYIVSVEDISGFGAQLNVYKGDCGGLVCAANYTGGRGFVVETEANTVFTIIVTFCCDNDRIGNFNLRIKPVAVGNLSEDGVSLVAPASGNSIVEGGSTEGGLFYPSLPSCHSDIAAAASVYKFQATQSGTMTATVTGFGISAQVSAYKEDGSGGFVCAGTHDWRSASWSAEQSEMVYLVVSDCCDPMSTGNFLLRIETTEPGSLCGDMVDLGAIPASGVVHAGSTVAGSLEEELIESVMVCPFETFGSFGDAPAVAFKVDGTNRSLTASLFVPFGRGGEFDGSIAVMKGSCGAFECPESVYTHSSRSISWTGEEGLSYFLLVSGCCGANSGGAFVLTVRETNSEVREDEQLDPPTDHGEDAGDDGARDDSPAFNGENGSTTDGNGDSTAGTEEGELSGDKNSTEANATKTLSMTEAPSSQVAAPTQNPTQTTSQRNDISSDAMTAVTSAGFSAVVALTILTLWM